MRAVTWNENGVVPSNACLSNGVQPHPSARIHIESRHIRGNILEEGWLGNMVDSTSHGVVQTRMIRGATRHERNCCGNDNGFHFFSAERQS